MTLGIRIKMLRESQNISREQMKDHLPMSLNTYKKIEYGDKIPTLDELKTICEVLKVDPAIFFKDTQTTIINNSDYSTGAGDVIINDKELIIELTKTLNKLADIMNKIGNS